MQPYYTIKDELSVYSNIILKTYQIVIPSVLRSDILKKLHESHMGIQHTQSPTRQYINWPNLNNDDYNKTSNCEISMRCQNYNPKNEILIFAIISILGYKVGCHILELNKNEYMLLVGYYSKYPDIELLHNGFSAFDVGMVRVFQQMVTVYTKQHANSWWFL